MIFVKNNVFRLNTAQSSYIFRVTEQGDLEHLYYGRKIKFQENYDAFLKKIRSCLSARCILKQMLLTESIKCVLNIRQHLALWVCSTIWLFVTAKHCLNWKCVPTDIKKFVPFWMVHLSIVCRTDFQRITTAGFWLTKAEKQHIYMFFKSCFLLCSRYRELN